MGHLLGAGDLPSAERAAYAGVSITIGFMIIIAICYWIFPTPLIAIDLDIHSPHNAKIIRFATNFLSICAIFQIFESTRIALFGALRGLKDTRFTLIISMVSFWGIALPVGYLLSTRFGLTGAGLWWGMVVGALSSVPLLFWRFKLKIRDYLHVSSH